MKAEDYRIGNILNWQVGRSIMQGKVTSISTNTIVIDHKSNFKIASESDSYRLIPIPLTEEWLLKFGFEKFTGTYPSYDKAKLSIRLYDLQNKEKGRTYFNSWAIIEQTPEYVHQLQNLYFCLCGEELTSTEIKSE